MNAPHLTRRGFTAALGGIVLSFSLAPKVLLGQAPAQLPGSLQTNRMLDAWLRINADGSVTVFTGKVELGQGIVTALAQIAAEELDVPLGRVTMENDAPRGRLDVACAHRGRLPSNTRAITCG